MLEHLLRDVRENINRYERSLVAGATEDYASYRELVGKIAGLRIAENIALDLLKATEEDA